MEPALYVGHSRSSRPRPRILRPRSGPISAGTPVRVLVVDDYEDARRLYVDACREAGMDVSEASGGDEAVELAARVEPSVILMDLSMPGTDGWEATRRIRATTGGSQPFIIALTAAAGEESRRQAFEAGCDAFIEKPCTPDVLVAAVNAAIHRSDDD